MAQRMDSLEEKFLNTIKENNLIEVGDVIVVGVSGGPDSITLLTCLNKYKDKLKCKLIVAHINHLIRKDSTDDEKYVEKVCEKMNIPFYAKRAKVEEIAKESKTGTEEAGRKIRYDFFDEILKKEHASKIAIAHNMNDNAETMLLNILRGCGMSGLEGIQPSEYGKYIRPLINIQRKEIEEYCEKNELEPRIDSTNKENIYKRNIIRNEMLPYLKEFNPNIVQSLSNTSKIIKENNDFVKGYSENEFNKMSSLSVNKIEIDTKMFNEESLAVRKNIVLIAINKLTKTTKNVQKSNIDDIIRMAEKGIGNKTMQINKAIKVTIKNKKIFLEL